MRSPSALPPPHDASLLDAFRLHGDRTSSLASLGSQFESRQPVRAPGLLRVLDTPGALIAASEPLPDTTVPVDRLEAALKRFLKQ